MPQAIVKSNMLCALPSASLVRRSLRKLLDDAPLVYVDCGARAGRRPDWLRALKDTLYVGFEADAGECDRLNAAPHRGHRYVAAFLAGATGQRTFFATSSAACASLYRPNIELLQRFAGLAPLFEIEREISVLTTTLEDSLAAAGVTAVDFVELDTQGSELEILQGAKRLLTNGVLGIQVEVEFAPMYVDQPLFADVDSYLRGRGFDLLDLSTYRARNAAAPTAIPTRGQLLWGHALYLRDVTQLEPRCATRLAVIASMLDRPDIAASALRQVSGSAPDKDLRQRATAALAVVTQDSQGFSPRTLVDRWHRRGADARLRASVNRTTWRD